ncbi:thioesterase family protein [Zavarzinia sp.]|uniref:thioesterase family protein n=1 Tax=Zavarzinia sp. TaxID=2027920 RepID=UPI00356AEF0B
MTPFTDVLAGIARQGDSFSVGVAEDWVQGRTLYGGASAAFALAAALRAFDGLPPLRSAQFAFIGPAAGMLTLSPSILRQGRSATYVGVDVAGEAGLATRALLCFGTVRESAVEHVALPAPAAPPAEACEDFFRGGMRPNFAHHFDMLQAGGEAPFSMAERPEYLLWLRHKDRAAANDVVSLIALADAPPPAAMVRFPTFGPISSMTWSIEVLNEKAAGPDDGWRLEESIAETATHGYSAQAMKTWAADGTPLLVSRQTVAIFV